MGLIQVNKHFRTFILDSLTATAWASTASGGGLRATEKHWSHIYDIEPSRYYNNAI